MIQRWGALDFSQKFRGGPSNFTHELRWGLKISYLEIREGGHGFYPTCSKMPHFGDSKLLKYNIKTLNTCFNYIKMDIVCIFWYFGLFIITKNCT